VKLYRFLLSFYPARFREEYAGPLQQQFVDDYREARTFGARCGLWLSALRDLAWSIPIELAHEIKQDLSHSLRVHARRPFVTTFTVAILALAIGGATGVFSVVNAVLIKSLPFRDPDRLVVLSGFNMLKSTSAQFHEWSFSSTYLEDAVQAFTGDVTIGGLLTPVRVTLAQTSFNFFSTLGAEPLIGRAFASSEDVPGNDGVAVIGYSLWQQLYGGDPGALGSKLLLNGEPLTIVGVARPGFDYPHKSSVWSPTAFDHARLPFKGAAWYPFGRLKQGVSFRQAEQMFEADSPESSPRSSSSNDDKLLTQTRLIPLKTDLTENVREASLILLGAVCFVLLIACADVANLLWTRISQRRGELMIRAALGASRARLAQQLLSESLLLSLAASAAGLAIAYWAATLAARVEPPALAAQEYTILDWRVLGFAVGFAVMTGFLFGVVPAWLATDPVRIGKSRPRTASLRSVLLAVQVALTLVLLAASVTMGSSFLHLVETDLGFRTDHLVSIGTSLSGIGMSKEQTSSYYRDALDRLRAVPGVESAAAAYNLPIDTMFGMGPIMTDSGRETPPLLNNSVTPDYFRTMGMPLVYGREFTAADTGNVAILSEGVARQIAEGTAVLGRKIILAGGKKIPFTIVGVVRSAHFAGAENGVREQYFLPLSASPAATFVVRVRGDADSALAVCRDAVQSVNRDVPVYNVKTIQRRFEETLARPRFRTTILLFFGGFALLLAIAGIYGVSSYSITQRRREIGIRIAIGASASGVRAMILRQALWPIGAGMLVGLGGAAWQGRLIEHLLSSAPPVDMPACAASAVLLAAVAIASIWSATSRVVELNPVEVLKSE
jgi:predicted permease